MRVTKASSVFGIMTAIMVYSSVASHADEVADFYKDKKLTFIAGTSAGGGYDLYSRTLMEFMPQHIPGKPTAIVQNMPGAGGIKATDYVYHVAPKNGTVLAMVPSGIVLAEVLRPQKVKYKSSKLSWIGTMTTMTDVLAVFKDTGLKTIEDAKKTTVIVGATGEYASNSLEPRLVNALLGTKFRIVKGYKSGNELNLAMDRGEVKGRTNQWTSWKSQRPEWIQENKLAYLLQFGPKDPELQDVPSFDEFVTSPQEKAMVDTLALLQFVGRSAFAPPEIPEKRLAALRQAFDETMKDPDFIARMKKLDLKMSYRKGTDLQIELTRIMANVDHVSNDIKKTLGLE